jgi:transcriptional regulator of nitric oxide reductase
MNLLVTMAPDGGFLDVSILHHNEPIFVSGLGPGPFHAFVQQYRGLTIGQTITIGSGGSSGQRSESKTVYLDGITKATASVRIANESILGAALQVARERMRGIAPRAASLPLKDYEESLTWEDLVDEGLAQHIRVTNQDVQSAFAGTVWEGDDPEAQADPEGLYLDLWVIDIGPPSVAAAVLSSDTITALNRNLEVHEEAILLLANGRHRLVGPDFVRNSAPEYILAVQDGLPVTVYDADIEAKLLAGIPTADQVMILRADTRLGFDPASPWTLQIQAARERGVFRPDIGTQDLDVAYTPAPRFFEAPATLSSTPPWLAALYDRQWEIIIFLVFIAGLGWLLAGRTARLATHPRFPAFRLVALAVTVVFLGWVTQGQLSIVTPLGVIENIWKGGSLAFLLYEPFLLVVWVVTIISLFVWGRGFFCGWLCPYGALQEFTHRLGRLFRVRQWRDHPLDDRYLKRVKYIILAALVVATLTSTTVASLLVELEPFKTAVTLHFDRAAPFVLYAAFWLVAGVFFFKPFCRYVCPLGAALAIGGKVRLWNWIPRRAECGTPCQFCKVSCEYGAIEKSGKIDYDECFQCLDCVTIIEDKTQCIPEIVAAKKGKRLAVAKS